MLAIEDPRDPENDLGKGSFNFDRMIRPALDFAYQQLSAPSKADESILARIVRWAQALAACLHAAAVWAALCQAFYMQACLHACHLSLETWFDLHTESSYDAWAMCIYDRLDLDAKQGNQMLIPLHGTTKPYASSLLLCRRSDTLILKLLGFLLYLQPGKSWLCLRQPSFH